MRPTSQRDPNLRDPSPLAASGSDYSGHASSRPDPITLELYRHRFAGVAEEMGVTLRRTGYSPNIKERLDFSCAVFDGAGRMLAQAAHIPAHLGAMPASVSTILDRFSVWQPGDTVIVNDPFDGGNHLPDITMISPVFCGNPTPQPGLEIPAVPDFFVASRAHHADVGGMTPGSLPLSTEIYQEGIIIPPVKLYKAGELDADLLRLILRNVRTPGERRGDLAAQRAAAAVGARRLEELVQSYGRYEVDRYAEHLLAYSERMARAAIRTWPDGEYTFEDVLELVTESPVNPSPANPSPTPATSAGDSAPSLPPADSATISLVPIRVCARIHGDEVTFDFAGTAAVMHGSLNTVLAVTQSACYYVVRCLVGEDAPMNAGSFAPVHVLAPADSVVHAQSPAAVAGGNVETSQRITDVVLGALAQALPQRVPAAAQGTMNNLTIGGKTAHGAPYAYYETIAGGMGASAEGDGIDGVQVHMTNTLNTPVEALEMAFPFRLHRYALRADSGGSGTRRGGDGIVREYEMRAPATVTMLSERRAVAPWGLAQGQPGKPGRNLLIRAGGQTQELPSKFTVRLDVGDRLRIETPGGGGWGAEHPAES